MVSEAVCWRVFRAILGWSQMKLAEKLRVHPNTIRNWEIGDSVPNAANRKVLEQIALRRRIRIRPDGYPEPVE